MRSDDYHLTKQQADAIGGITLLPKNIRVEALARLLKDEGGEWLVELFAEFIGLANSVAENNRTYVEGFMKFKGMIPQDAKRMNLPTIFGAVVGTSLAQTVNQKATCETCAFRCGTPPNQSLQTGMNAMECRSDREPFYCHEGLKEGDVPTRLCAGFAQVAYPKEPAHA